MLKRLALIISFVGLLPSGCKENDSLAKLPTAAATGPRAVRTANVQVSMDRDEIRATGTAAAPSTTKVMPVVTGLIKRLPVQEGDVVKRGQVLAVLDQRQYRLALRQGQVAVEGAGVALDATTREKQRFEKLLQQDATARAQYDQVMDKYRGAQAQMKQAQVALDMAKKALSDTVITAPYTGVVIKKLASLGDYATAMPPTVVLVLQEISTLEVKISLPEPELNRVDEGAAAEVDFTSIDRKVQAKIARVIRTVDPMTRSFEAIVEINNEKMDLRPGLYARVKISTSKPRRRLLVPDEAVVDEGSDVYSVFVLDGAHARRREVRVSAADRGQSEVVSGLSGDETVIIDATGLIDGDEVTVRAGGAAKETPGKPQPTAEAAR